MKEIHIKINKRVCKKWFFGGILVVKADFNA
jgi:hypothetical protein